VGPKEARLSQRGLIHEAMLLRSLAVAAAVLLLAQGVMAAPAESGKDESEPFKRLTVDEAEKLLADPNVMSTTATPTRCTERAPPRRGASPQPDMKEGVFRRTRRRSPLLLPQRTVNGVPQSGPAGR